MDIYVESVILLSLDLEGAFCGLHERRRIQTEISSVVAIFISIIYYFNNILLFH